MTLAMGDSDDEYNNVNDDLLALLEDKDSEPDKDKDTNKDKGTEPDKNKDTNKDKGTEPDKDKDTNKDTGTETDKANDTNKDTGIEMDKANSGLEKDQGPDYKRRRITDRDFVIVKNRYGRFERRWRWKAALAYRQ